ncbi:MAG: LysR family transcriptional regulator [Acetobacteraceae bacterium]
MLVRHLSYFVTLAREKHYARAAEACNIAQPTLSAAIRKLEDDLQVHLVVRSHRFVGLTPDGEKVLEWGRQILTDYTSLREDLTGLRQGLTGTLRLGVIPTAMPATPFLTARFAAAHPSASISIRSMTSQAIQDGIDAFEIDGGLTYLDNEPLANLRRVPLYQERYVFVTRRGNRHSDRTTLTWAEALQEPLCLLSDDMQNRRILNRIAAGAGLPIHAAVVSNSFLGIWAHIAQGVWSSIVPYTFSYLLGQSSDLMMAELVEPVESQSIGLVLSNRVPPSPVAAALLAVASNVDLQDDLVRATNRA